MGPTDGATADGGGNFDVAHGPYTLGDTRAVMMIEGPSREALELVEVAPARQ